MWEEAEGADRNGGAGVLPVTCLGELGRQETPLRPGKQGQFAPSSP